MLANGASRILLVLLSALDASDMLRLSVLDSVDTAKA